MDDGRTPDQRRCGKTQRRPADQRIQRIQVRQMMQTQEELPWLVEFAATLQGLCEVCHGRPFRRQHVKFTEKKCISLVVGRR